MRDLGYYLLGVITGICIASYFMGNYNKANLEKCLQSIKSPANLKLSSKVGETQYKVNCAVCHGATGEGQSGPDIRYSSLELLNLKVLEGRYPEGYMPQRNTNIMPKFPYLTKQLPEIHKYLKGNRP